MQPAVTVPPMEEMLKAAGAGLDQWFHDEVYAANRELQECLLAAANEKDSSAGKKAHDECIARFKARLTAADASLVEARKASTEVINELRGSAPVAPLK